MAFAFMPLKLKDAFCIEYFYAGDNRGDFGKIFEKDIYKEAGIKFTLSESFTSTSQKNVIRGLHFQKHNPQTKLVSVMHGKVWDVIVDLRPDSPTFKEWEAIELSRQNHKALFVPCGFAHGFAALEDDTVMLYQCDGKYDKETDGGVRFDDPEIGIKWPIDLNTAIHSKRDLELESFMQYCKNPIIIRGGVSVSL